MLERYRRGPMDSIVGVILKPGAGSEVEPKAPEPEAWTGSLAPEPSHAPTPRTAPEWG